MASSESEKSELEDTLREVTEREQVQQGVSFLVKTLYVAWAAVFLGIVLGFFQSSLPIITMIVVVTVIWLSVAGALLDSEGLRDWLKEGWVFVLVAIACLWFGQVGGETLAEVVRGFAGMVVNGDEVVRWHELYQPPS